MTSRLTASLALALSIAGCAGAKPPEDDLVLGRTSREEILQRLGSPYREDTVTKNGKRLETMTYAFATTGGTPVRAGVSATRGQGFYFLDDKLAGYDFSSSWKEDQTDFDGAKVPQIKKGVTTRDEVLRLIGRPGGKYAYPLISDTNGQADVDLCAESSGTPVDAKLEQKLLVESPHNRDGGD